MWWVGVLIMSVCGLGSIEKFIPVFLASMQSCKQAPLTGAGIHLQHIGWILTNSGVAGISNLQFIVNSFARVRLSATDIRNYWQCKQKVQRQSQHWCGNRCCWEYISKEPKQLFRERSPRCAYTCCTLLFYWHLATVVSYLGFIFQGQNNSVVKLLEWIIYIRIKSIYFF